MKAPTAVGSVLLIDDDEGFARVVSEVGRQTRCTVQHAATLESAQRLAEQRSFDLILVDIGLPDGNGLDWIENLDLARHGRIAVVTGMPSVESAVRVVKSPVVDYLIKPVTAQALQQLLLETQERATKRSKLSRPFSGMVGASASMRALYGQIRRVGPTDVSVLVSGESGTGKELVAHAVHEESGRNGRFIAVNCGAITSDLLGSQLFGHDRGAFTGAVQSHAGYFEQAEGGTLFLDEITEMPLQLQVYLLRVLESCTLTRLGGSRELPINVRLVAATNRDAQASVEAGTLRHDLYYRLIEFPLSIPPLRERLDDVPLLARHFLGRLNERYGTDKSFEEGALRRMSEARWPGNVRELRHAVQRNFILAGDAPRVGYEPGSAPPKPLNGDSVRFSVGMRFEDVEREMLLKTLARCDNNKRRAAEILGITSKTIYNRLLRYRAQGLIDDETLGDGVSDDADGKPPDHTRAHPSAEPL